MLMMPAQCYEKPLQNYLHTFKNGGHFKYFVSNFTKPSAQRKIFTESEVLSEERALSCFHVILLWGTDIENFSKPTLVGSLKKILTGE